MRISALLAYIATHCGTDINPRPTHNNLLHHGDTQTTDAIYLQTVFLTGQVYQHDEIQIWPVAPMVHHHYDTGLSSDHQTVL